MAPQRPKAAAAVRRAQGSEESKTFLAIDLRARGRSFHDIGRELKCSAKAAEARVNRALEGLKREAAERALALDFERLDRMLEGLCSEPRYDDKGRLVSGGAFGGEPQAVIAALKIIERRAKYLGLDAPEKHEHTGALSVGPTIMVPAE